MAAETGVDFAVEVVGDAVEGAFGAGAEVFDVLEASDGYCFEGAVVKWVLGLGGGKEGEEGGEEEEGAEDHCLIEEGMMYVMMRVGSRYEGLVVVRGEGENRNVSKTNNAVPMQYKLRRRERNKKKTSLLTEIRFKLNQIPPPFPASQPLFLHSLPSIKLLRPYCRYLACSRHTIPSKKYPQNPPFPFRMYSVCISVSRKTTMAS